MAVCLVLLASHPAAATDPVSLQLKWKHQFQFAGYYAALEQGFYRDAGLDVTIREGGPDIDAAEAVAGRKADFGVCSSSVLREWVMGRHLVVLAVIFQQSPAIILVPRRADIRSLSDLRGRTLMDAPGSDEIAAMLKHEGVDYAALPRVDHRGDPRDLLVGRADAMVAYSTNEPFVLEQIGAAYRTFSPGAYGVDFYGDNLCTSEAEVKARPDRVAAFRAASSERLGLCAGPQGGDGRSDPQDLFGKKEPRGAAVRSSPHGSAGAARARPYRRAGCCALAKHRHDLSQVGGAR